MMNTSAESVKYYLILLTVITKTLYLKSVELRFVRVRVSPWAFPSVKWHESDVFLSKKMTAITGFIQFLIHFPINK